VKPFEWNEEKNQKLKKQRAISFKEVLIAQKEGRWLDVLDHPNKKRYANQKIAIVAIKGYAYIVPFVEDEEKLFLKTMIPSRKMTKKYLKGGEKA